MSIYFGDNAITYLANKAHQQDPKSCSHWGFYHSDFRFDDGEFSEYFTNISIATKNNSSFFYCCNRENKVLPDDTVVDFEKYPRSMANQILDDELYPWHLKYYSTKPPFYHYYDGPIRHSLAQFS